MQVVIYGWTFGRGICCHRRMVCGWLLQLFVNCFLVVGKFFISEFMNGFMNGLYSFDINGFIGGIMGGVNSQVLVVILWVGVCVGLWWYIMHDKYVSQSSPKNGIAPNSIKCMKVPYKAKVPH